MKTNYLMRQLKQFTFGTLVMATALGSAQSFAGDRVGNGGLIEKLIQAELKDRATLSIKEINTLLVNKGESLKTEVLIPVMEEFLEKESLGESSQLKEYREKILKQSKRFFLDIKISHIQTGDCKGNTTCTGNNIYDTVYVDLKEIDKSSYGISFSELIGLLGHEYLHHFFHELSNHDDYPFARNLKKRILNNNFKTVTYDFKLINKFKNESNNILLEKPYNSHLFCLSKGHSKSRDVSVDKVYAYELHEAGYAFRGVGSTYDINTYSFKKNLFDDVVERKRVLKDYSGTMINIYSEIRCWK